MRLGVVGDVHGNLEALDAVLARLDRLNVDRLACVGDLVGYGADPRRCMERLRERTSDIVAGNHDWAAVGKLSPDYFNGPARAAVQWTASLLDENEKRFLAELPLVRELDWGTLVHASFLEPGNFHYVFRPADAARSFPGQPSELAFFGHTHVPGAFFDADPVFFTSDPLVKLPPRRRAFVNCGSVGQPRDANPESSFAVLDTESRTVQFLRVPYDVGAAAAKILAAGLPDFLAQRLFLGY